MALTLSHPGVIRFHKSLWLANPNVGDVKKLKRQRRGSASSRNGSLIPYLVVAAVFAPVILLNVYASNDLKRAVASWVPAVDLDAGFGGLLSVIAIVLLGVIAWFAYRNPDTESLMATKQAISIHHFESASATVTNTMPWDGLWRLGRSLAQLEEESFASYDADQRGDASAARRSRRIVREQLREAQDAADDLGITVDLSYFAESVQDPEGERP